MTAIQLTAQDRSLIDIYVQAIRVHPYLYPMVCHHVMVEVMDGNFSRHYNALCGMAQAYLAVVGRPESVNRDHPLVRGLVDALIHDAGEE